MKKMFLILACLFAITDSFSQGLIIHKNDGSNTIIPIAEINSITFSQTAGDVVFYDDFESGINPNYIIPIGHTPPIISSIAYVSPTHSMSLAAPRNWYSVMGMDLLEPSTANIFGISCKMMKNNVADSSNFGLFLFQGLIVPNDTQLGMGIWADSIYISNLNESNPTENHWEMVDIIEINRWYTFTIEHNFTTHKSSFFIDYNKIYETTLTISSIDNFYFGDWSSEWYPNINESLFIDDLTLYKR